jgi:hypothetical protein
LLLSVLSAVEKLSGGRPLILRIEDLHWADSASTGCQSFEATDFFVHRRRLDTSSALAPWQIGVLEVRDARIDNCPTKHLDVLAEVLVV